MSSRFTTETMRAYQGVQYPDGGGRGYDRTVDFMPKPQMNRDEDGVDWVPDPPEALKFWLLLFKIQNHSKGIGLGQNLRYMGAKPNGLMQRDQFCIAITTTYREWRFSTQFLKSVCHAYGTGLADPSGEKESVAWKDFCEDVDAQDYKNATWEHDMIVRGRHDEIGEDCRPEMPTKIPSPYDFMKNYGPAKVKMSFDLDGDGKTDQF